MRHATSCPARNTGPPLQALALAVAVIVSVTPRGGGAQTPRERPLSDTPIVVSPLRLSLPRPFQDPEAALVMLADMRAESPDDVTLALAVAREATALGELSDSLVARNRWLMTAEHAARDALTVDPLDADSHYWLSASLGLRAHTEGGRTKISLARESYDHARRALELDSLHGGASHIVGRLHSGAKRLGWVTRVIARGLGLGAILDEASWESAERHLRVGVAHDPDQLAHHFELGKLLAEYRPASEAEGYQILRDVATRRPRHRLEVRYIDLAAGLLDRLGVGLAPDSTGLDRPSSQHRQPAEQGIDDVRPTG